MTEQELTATIYMKLMDAMDKTKERDWEEVVAQCEEVAGLASQAHDLGGYKESKT